MKCKKCGSEKLKIVQAGPHQKLVCTECLAFQKFLSKKDADTFMQLQDSKFMNKIIDEVMDEERIVDEVIDEQEVSDDKGIQGKVQIPF